MKKLIRYCLSLALVGTLLSGCASLIGPRDIELPLSKLQSGIDRRFPLHNKALELLDIELSRPLVSMLPENGRIALTMEALVAPSFSHQSWHGSLVLSGRLYLDVERGLVLMGEPHVDQFQVDGVDEARQRQFSKVANVLMKKVVADVPLYHFRMEDLHYGGVQFVPTRITTNAAGLLVSVEPAR
ncbi:MAG: DUF1439 domain-containing protein [Massilia sp.]